MIIGSNLVFSAWDGDRRQLGRMDHSPEEERDCGNKPTEANLTAVNGGPSVHQTLSTNDGGGEMQYQLLTQLFQINKLASKSNVHQFRGVVQIIRACFVGNRLVESVCDSSFSCRVNEDSAQ